MSNANKPGIVQVWKLFIEVMWLKQKINKHSEVDSEKEGQIASFHTLCHKEL